MTRLLLTVALVQLCHQQTGECIRVPVDAPSVLACQLGIGLQAWAAQTYPGTVIRSWKCGGDKA